MLFTLNSNEPIRVAHIQKLANQSMLNGALLTAKVKNVQKEISKRDMVSEKYISTRFC